MTGQLSVWRRFHIEQDVMAQTDGDLAVGEITASSGAIGGLVSVTTDIDATMDEYENGILVPAGGSPLVIKGNTAGPNAIFIVVASGAVPLTDVTAYQDDYALTGGVPTTIVDTTDDDHLYDLLQETPNRDLNRFADAYIQPELDTLNEFDSAILARVHVEQTDDAMRQAVGDGRGTDNPGDETEKFWVGYVSTAFDGPVQNDNDPAVEQGFMGLTTDDNTISLVFLETTRDVVGPPPGQQHVADFHTGVARITVHEVGHQFLNGGLPDRNEHRNNPDNIMDAAPLAVAPGDCYFASEEVATYRMRVASP